MGSPVNGDRAARAPAAARLVPWRAPRAPDRCPDRRWALEYHYAGKTWVDFGPPRAPNKWVTLRAPRALKNAP